MIERIKDGIWYLRLCMESRQQRRHSSAPVKGCCTPIKGNMRSVVVIKPDSAMFDEAVFVLSDEYMRQHGASSEEILRQAREAVEKYGGKNPPPGGRSWILLCVPLLTALAVAVYFWIF